MRGGRQAHITLRHAVVHQADVAVVKQVEVARAQVPVDNPVVVVM